MCELSHDVTVDKSVYCQREEINLETPVYVVYGDSPSFIYKCHISSLDIVQLEHTEGKVYVLHCINSEKNEEFSVNLYDKESYPHSINVINKFSHNYESFIGKEEIT